MRRRALALCLLLVALCALGFLLRTTNAATVFVGDAVVFAENDPYYHLRRVFQILADYPRVPGFDPWIDHPNGAPVVFAPLFDLAVATLAKLAGLGPSDRVAVETLAAFVPPVLGALTCLPVFWLALQATSPGAAALAALLVTLVPAHIWYSRLGFVDHHVAVTLVQVALLALVLRALDVGRTAAARSSRPVRLFCAVLATLALAAGMLLWNGYLLLVAVLDACLVVLFLVAGAPRRRTLARLACAMHLGAALLVLPVVVGIVRETGAALSAVTLSYLHVVLLAAFGCLSGLAAWVSGRHWPLRRLVVLFVAAAALVGAALLVERDVVAGVLSWLRAADPFMGAVQESVSIVFTSDKRLDLEGPQIWMSRFFFLAPLLLAWLAYRVVRGRGRDEGRLVVLVWAALLFFLTLRQRRFGEVAAPALAVLVADSLVELARSARARLLARGLARGAADALVAAGVALLIVLAFAPYYRGFLAAPDRLTAVLRAPLRSDPAAAVAAVDRAQQEASSDVRLHRALTRFGALVRRSDAVTGAAGAPAGVMNPWPLGHKLLYVAGTPVTATPFGSYVGGSAFADGTDFFLATDEERALEILARRGSRWVVVDNDLGTIGAAIVGRGENPRDYYAKQQTKDGVTYVFQPPLVRSLYLRLTRLGGSEVKLPAAAGAAAETVPALDHLRLVLDSANDDEIGFPKAYQVVRGADLVVHGAREGTVRARYAYRSDAGRERVYEKTVAGDARGEARIVLPYSSERPDLGQTSPWLIESAGRTRELRVAERDVLEGRALDITLD